MHQLTHISDVLMFVEKIGDNRATRTWYRTNEKNAGSFIRNRQRKHLAHLRAAALMVTGSRRSEDGIHGFFKVRQSDLFVAVFSCGRSPAAGHSFVQIMKESLFGLRQFNFLVDREAHTEVNLVIIDMFVIVSLTGHHNWQDATTAALKNGRWAAVADDDIGLSKLLDQFSAL